MSEHDEHDSPRGPVPPQDLGAEQSVLGSMMLSKDAISESVEVVKGHEFYRPAHEVIFDAIVDLFGRGEPVDAITVADELGKRGDLTRVGGQAYLHQLIQAVPVAASASYYADIVHERATLRALVEAGTRIVQMGYSQGEGEIDDIVNRAQAEVYAVGGEQKSEHGAALADMLDSIITEIEEAENNPGGIGLSTGFTDLDAYLHGLEPGQLIIVGGRPGSGKTTLGTDIARYVGLDCRDATLVFSLEMGGNELGKKIVAAEAGVMHEKMRMGDMKQPDWDRIARRAIGKISEGRVFIEWSPNMTLVEIRAKARWYKQHHNLKLVVVDYLQLVTTGKKAESREKEVSEISRSLKLLAKELELPIIALCQLNRGPEQRVDKRPSVADLRESGSLEQDADIVLLVHPIKDDPEREGESDIIVGKNRHGRTGDVTLAFQGHYGRFANMAKDSGF